ncbi:MAG TPA: UvrD-helicase domain-containing protein [Candidatus Paceibacterota bacterium]|nr:UvrD-helicase domain-containing protein [Candidatus Paceibacterota bacterium]
MNPAQSAAAKAKNGPLLIVAGAGTGKTKTLTSRIVHLIESGMSPERICAITFTNKAAKEMANRVSIPGPLISTFHSLGARILRKECRLLGRSPNFAIFDDHDSFDLLKKAVKAVLPKPPKEDGAFGNRQRLNKKETPAFFGQRISEIKNKDGAIDELRAATDGTSRNVVKVYEHYEAALARNNAFDFDDLIEKPVAIFRQHPNVLRKYQSMFDAILVDEYQDINPKQCEFITLLAEGHRNLSVVGDDEQTIYSWRYANIKTFLDFDKVWKGASVHFLEENYRSTGTIIRAAAGVVKNNSFRTPKNLWTKNPDGERIALFEAWGENEEAEWIAQEIGKRRVRDDLRREEQGNRGERQDAAEEIAILYRTNAQSRAIEQALIRRDIPYRIFGGLKFYERREVKDAMAALRYISNDKDEVAKDRLEKNLTKRRFAEFRARLIKSAFQGGPTAADDGGPAIKPVDALKLFLETFNYVEYLEDNFINSDEREENIAELVAFAGEFESLPDFLEKLSLLQATDDVNEQKNRGEEVSLMTIHLAKGLEFDTVFIAGAAEGLLPHGRSLDDDASLEEERRLMYVAMTRARKNLAISFYGIPSRFISEIPEDCVTFAAGSASSYDDGDGTRGRRGLGAGDSDGFDESEGFEERSVFLD